MLIYYWDQIYSHFLSSRRRKMAASGFFFLLFICFIHRTVTSEIICKESSCLLGFEPAVHFPFRLNYTNQIRCGYGPDFVLSCDDRRRTILNLPSSGRFVVIEIDYLSLTLLIDDPDECLPRRLLQNFSVANSPFLVDSFESITFVNCSNTDEASPYFWSIRCLNSDNFTVKATKTAFIGEISSIPPSCRLISTVMVPITWDSGYYGINAYIKIRWTDPDCRSCERRGGDCGFKSSSGLNIGCSKLPTSGLPRAAKYGIILGAVIPGFLFIVGLCSCICAKMRLRAYQHRNTSVSDSAVALASVTVVGLDEPTIQSYPKTMLGASRRLPKPNDSTCSICLSDYQPTETLRTIPDCGHYFHASCIDEWLKMNATCPLCRNSPEGSSSSNTSLSSPMSFSSLLSFSSS